MNSNEWLLLLVVFAVLVFGYYYLTSSNKKVNKPSEDFLKNVARGCLHRLRGVVREDLATKENVQEFVSVGDKKLVVLSNIDPEKIVSNVIDNNTDFMNKLRLVAVGSGLLNGTKNYIVLMLKDGNMSPIGAPTKNFDEAFDYMERTARKYIGDDTNNLVFMIDEDIPCPPLPVKDVDPDEGSKKEKCCGRRW
jgi:hypothetical protein